MMRSVLALVGAAFFALQAFSFMAAGTYLNEASDLAGEPAALALTSAVRTLSIGLTILSLALVDWSALRRLAD